MRVCCRRGDLDALPVHRRDEERKNGEEVLHEVGGGGRLRTLVRTTYGGALIVIGLSYIAEKKR